VLIGAASLGVILGLRRLAPAVPGALVLVAGGLLASALFDLDAQGVALVGEVPRGLRCRSFPTLGLSATMSRSSPSRPWRCC
jgi:SulP family sulfate permease